MRRWGEERPALIFLTGNPDPDLLADLDPALVRRAEPREMRAAMLGHLDMRRFNWTAIPAPTGGWATQVFGEPDVERLWNAVATATRLDEADPVAAWTEHLARLQAKADVLNTRGFDAIRFRGPGSGRTGRGVDDQLATPPHLAHLAEVAEWRSTAPTAECRGLLEPRHRLGSGAAPGEDVRSAEVDVVASFAEAA
jgi:hypothetical protein